MRTPPAFWGGLQLAARDHARAERAHGRGHGRHRRERGTLDLDPASRAYAHLIAADLAAARGDASMADRELTGGLAAAQRIRSPMLALAAETRRLALARRLGRPDDGAALRRALDRVAEGHDLPDARAARALLETPEG